MNRPKSVLITGASGYIGSLTTAALAAEPKGVETIVAADLRPCPTERKTGGVIYAEADVRSAEMADLMARHRVEAVIHLASIVTPGRKPDRELEYSVDVLGADNILRACLKAGVKKIIVTSSGAAYGYYADNSVPLTESDPIRGNPEFAYSDHKRLIEEMLARCRTEHPELSQLIFRPGTVLGATVRNQISDLFDAKRIIGLRRADSPFVFIWDQDVVDCLLLGLSPDKQGVYNLAGDGVLTMRQIAERMNKPYLNLPVAPVRAGLWLLKKLRLTQYGPEQVNFLRYRPVLSNRALKEEFGYTPAKTTAEVFDYFLEQRRLQ